MATVLITGAARGVGLALAQTYAEAGDSVIATCRAPAHAEELNALALNAGVEVHFLDVDDPGLIEAFAAKIGARPIDILINNAGIYAPKAQPLRALDAETWLDHFRTNTLAPVFLARAFEEHLAQTKGTCIALTSKVGSIADNTSGGGYMYRSSKSALNAAYRSLSIDWRDRNITVAVFHPGWVQTAMGGPNALISPAESAAGLRARIAGLSPEDSGGFFDYLGRPIPW